jgi:hypothetical protein
MMDDRCSISMERGPQLRTSLTASLLVVDADVLVWTNDLRLAQVLGRNRLQRYLGTVRMSKRVLHELFIM